MEKFGIFELLDTLSAILIGENGEKAPETPPLERPSMQDPAFSPPAYSGAQTGTEQSTNTALSSFLARHDSVSKKIGGK